VFVNHREEDKIYPLTTIEIATAQNKDHQIYYSRCKYIKGGFVFLIEDTIVLYKNENYSSQHL
jgi:hypothetical protein